MVGSTFHITSKYLKRVVKSHIFKSAYDPSITPITIIFNDGQDFNALKISQTFEFYQAKYPHIPIVIIGIDAGDRINEYGCSYKNDYKNRGNKALEYRSFIINEFVPYLKSNLQLKLEKSKTGFAGFSMGGLSAMDISLHNPDLFDFIGVFSGSFWWRYEPFTDDDPDGCRIMHEYIERSALKTGQRFWFQAGTKDEDCDRNGNGIIDSIDDTLDVIHCLEKKGFIKDKDLTYCEVKNGTHDPFTWGHIMPVFLDWVLSPLASHYLSKSKTA